MLMISLALALSLSLLSMFKLTTLHDVRTVYSKYYKQIHEVYTT